MEVLTKSMTLIFDAMVYMVPTSFVFSPITTQTELITLCGEIKNQILYFVPLSCHDIILEYFIFWKPIFDILKKGLNYRKNME